MKKYLAFISAGIVTAAALCASPAMARSDVDWTVTVGSGGYSPPVVYSPPPVVYGPPRVVYERPQPVYVERTTIVRYGRPYGDGYREGRRDGWQRGHDRDRWEDRHERQEHRRGHRYDY
jgi:hypothetical protein